MASFKPERSGGGGDREKRQPVRLEPARYGAMFSGYGGIITFPNTNRKSDKDPLEVKKFSVRFLVTHFANEKQIPRFTSASTLTGVNWNYDPKDKMSSVYFQLYAALLNYSMTPEEVDALADEGDLPDLDDLIGRPVMLDIVQKQDAKSPIIYNNVSKISGAPKSMRLAIKPLFDKLEFDYDEQTKHKFIKSPVPQYEDDAASNGSSSSNVADEMVDDEIPF